MIRMITKRRLGDYAKVVALLIFVWIVVVVTTVCAVDFLFRNRTTQNESASQFSIQTQP